MRSALLQGLLYLAPSCEQPRSSVIDQPELADLLAIDIEGREGGCRIGHYSEQGGAVATPEAHHAGVPHNCAEGLGEPP